MSANDTFADPQREFGFLLRDLARLHALNFERLAAGSAIGGLTLAQCRVLAYLQRNEGISKARLAALTDTDPMTLGRLLARMAEDGLVGQRIDPADRRAHCLHLTEQAKGLLAQIWEIGDRNREEGLADFDEDERRLLMKLLRRVQANLDAVMPGAADRKESPQCS